MESLEEAALRSADLVGFYAEEALALVEVDGVSLAPCVLLVAAVESALLAMACVKRDEIRRAWPKCPDNEPTHWKFTTLIKAGIRMGWLPVWDSPGEPDDPSLMLGNALRDLRSIRNWIHPGAVIREGVTLEPAPELVAAAWGIFGGALEVLTAVMSEANLPAPALGSAWGPHEDGNQRETTGNDE